MKEKKDVIKNVIITILSILFILSVGYIIYQKTNLKEVCINKYSCDTNNYKDENKECPKCEECKKCEECPKCDNVTKVVATENLRFIAHTYLDNFGVVSIGISGKDIYVDKGSNGHDTIKLDSDAVALNYASNCGGSFLVYALDSNGTVYVSKTNGAEFEKLEFIKAKALNIDDKIVGFRSVDTSSISCTSRSVNLVGISGKEYSVSVKCSSDGHIINEASIGNKSDSGSGVCIPK